MQGVFPGRRYGARARSGLIGAGGLLYTKAMEENSRGKTGLLLIVSMMVGSLLIAAQGQAAVTGGRAKLSSPPGSGGSCRPVSLDQSNVIGYMAVQEDEENVNARILVRSGGARTVLNARLSLEDAETLRAEIDALLRKERVRPIRFESSVARGGVCEVSRVVS